tara:strand:- start:4198 stop:5676 length:1479 start_codon:yes stop_codon:yes gene_type:complete
MISSQLPILQIIIPLVAAPLCILLRSDRYSWFIANVATISILGIVSFLMVAILENGPINYQLGGWIPPFGIEYRLDTLNIFVLLLISGSAALILPFITNSIEKEIDKNRRHFFYAIFLLTLTGLMGIVATNDIFNVYVFLEISSLGTYVLIGLGKKRQALTAAYRYLIQGTIGATFILIGIGFLYSATGTLNMADMRNLLDPIIDTRPVLAGISIMTAGILIKLALFPLHLWLPNAYTFAPSVVSAFLAMVSTKVAAYLLIRLNYSVFDISSRLDNFYISEVMIALSILAILIGSFAAILQKDIKSLLAMSSIAQIGYLVIGISIPTVTGLTGGIVHIFNHGLIKGSMFLAIACIVYRLGDSNLKKLKGLGNKMPFSSAALVIGGLGLVGIPGTSGFISKWYLVTAALESNLWPVAVVVLLGSLITIVYIGRLIEILYFAPLDKSAPQIKEAPLLLHIPVWILLAASIYFGLHADFTISVAENAATLLLGIK